MNPRRTTPLLAATVILLSAACSSKATPHAASTAVPSSTTATVPPASTSLTSPASTAPTTAESAGGPLPAGFTVADLTWVSDNEGWALGTAPCSRPPCTSVAHTLDGGRTWAGLPAPIAFLEAQGSPTCSATLACVRGIRFADRNRGYVFGVNSLWLTTNGGHTWTRKGSDNTTSLEISAGTVTRLTSGTCTPPGCPYQVQATAVGTASWQNLAAPAMSGVGGVVAVEGTNRYAAVFQHTAGGAQDAHTRFVRSTDGGAHWTTFADPCGVTPSGNEADATTLSGAAGGSLAVGCTTRASGEAAFVVVSADKGATFGPHRGNLLPAVSPDGDYVDHLAAATGQRLAVTVAPFTGGTTSIAVSNDAGIDWTVTHSEPSAGAVFLGFQDGQTGRAVINPRTVLTTTDGGGHWTGFTFP